MSSSDSAEAAYNNSHHSPGGQRSWLHRNRIKLAPWLFLLPGLIFFFIYVIAPIFQSIWISFYEWDGLSPKEWVGFANYIELLDDDRFYTSLINNVWWLVLYMLAVPAGLGIALFLNQTVTLISVSSALSGNFSVLVRRPFLLTKILLHSELYSQVCGHKLPTA